MGKCFICEEQSVKCEMSVYRPDLNNKEHVELICPDCRNDPNKW
jgi:hypothetical protein